MNKAETTLNTSETMDKMLCDYFKNDHKDHLTSAMLHSTPKGRMQLARERNQGQPDHVLLFDFIEHEFDCMDTGGKLLVYMPETLKGERLKGKIILEITTFENVVFYEIQIARKSNLGFPKEFIIDKGFKRNTRRIYNLYLGRESVIPFVQDFLFSERFTQRGLITMPPKVLNSITTQALWATSGQLFSFRKCLLNE